MSTTAPAGAEKPRQCPYFRRDRSAHDSGEVLPAAGRLPPHARFRAPSPPKGRTEHPSPGSQPEPAADPPTLSFRSDIEPPAGPPPRHYCLLPIRRRTGCASAGTGPPSDGGSTPAKPPGQRARQDFAVLKARRSRKLPGLRRAGRLRCGLPNHRPERCFGRRCAAHESHPSGVQ